MRNHDGGIWRLAWEKTASGYRGHVVSHPAVAAEGPTFDEMADLLYDRVSSKLQAGEWTADWSPPPPAKPGERGRVLESHVELAWEGRFVCLQDPRDLFESYCEACGMPTGPRTAAPIRMFIESPGNLCGDFGTAPGKLTIMSSELAELLRPMLGKNAELRPVERLGRGRKSYVEAVVSGPLPAPIALRGEKELGWKCPVCGHRYLYHDYRKHGETTFHRRSDLPVDDDAFWIQDDWRCPGLCVRTEWWKANRRSKVASGVVTSGIGVAEDADIDPDPTLRAGEAWRHREHWREKQENIARHYGVRFEPWKL